MFVFKVGDEAEVLYFAAKSDAEREEWMKAFRKGIYDATTCTAKLEYFQLSS